MSIALSIDDLRARVGHEVAISDWFEVTQTVINEFAATTRDMQWIHVDTERAARESPFRNADGQRCTVAHGFLTLSLLTPLFESGITHHRRPRRRKHRLRACCVSMDRSPRAAGSAVASRSPSSKMSGVAPS